MRFKARMKEEKEEEGQDEGRVACRGKQDRKIILLPTSLAAQLNLPKGPSPPPPTRLDARQVQRLLLAIFFFFFNIISSGKTSGKAVEKNGNAKRARPFVVAIKKFRLFCNNIMAVGAWPYPIDLMTWRAHCFLKSQFINCIKIARFCDGHKK